MARPGFILALLLAACFTLATCLQPQARRWTNEDQKDSLLAIALGDARRMFANHFFVKADVYFHSGYYPSIFDQGAKPAVDAGHLTEEHHEGKDEAAEEREHEKSMDVGKPRDWIEAFGRHFYPSTHTHLDKPGEAREILPWLRLSADLDPHRIDTYTVAAYWLRKHLGKTDEAGQFLLEGWRENPNSVEIIFELGQLEYENHHDITRARNLWELALRYWQAQEDSGQKPDDVLYQKLVINLAHLEEEQRNLQQALHYREMEVKVSPFPDVVRKEIAELRQQLASPQPKKTDSGPPAIR
jgi:tetratricopeptide (TPR) repeat protein